MGGTLADDCLLMRGKNQRQTLAAPGMLRQHRRVEEEPRGPIARYTRLPESGGCRRACVLHLIMMGMMFVLAIIWIVRNRAWELEITVEWPW